MLAAIEKEKEGLTYIGSGSYASVYGLAELDFVIKHGNTCDSCIDRGYLAYLKAIQEYGTEYYEQDNWGEEYPWNRGFKENPFLPRFFMAKIFKMGNEPIGYLVRMERLIGVKDVQSKSRFLKEIAELREYILTPGKDSKEFHNPDALNHLRRILAFALEVRNNGNDFDLHKYNWMMRGNQLVLIDPVS
jgi:hypothetical protein